MRAEELMKRHLGRPSKLELKNEDGTTDILEIKPLPWELFPEFWSVFGDLFEVTEAGAEMRNLSRLLDKGAIKTISFLLLETLKRSYPDVDEELLKKFITANYFDLTAKLMEVNLPVSATDDTRIKKKLRELKEKSRRRKT